MLRIMLARKALRGFTLIELLSSLAIVAVLATFLVPALRNFQSRSLEVTCASNLKQLGSALYSYAAENSGSFPTTQGSYWGAQPGLIAALSPYLEESEAVWFCKSQLRAANHNRSALYQAGNIGYYYWAWAGDFWDSRPMQTVSAREDSPWIVQGWNPGHPGVVLMSDVFGSRDAWGGPEDVQYHAGNSNLLSLKKGGSHLLISGGAVLKAAPLR